MPLARCAGGPVLQNAELVACKAATSNETLRWFVDCLIPEVQAREFGAGIRETRLDFSDLSTSGQHSEMGLETLHQYIPFPHWPSPSFFLCGRFWMLKPGVTRHRRLLVQSGGKTFGLTGEYWLAQTLERKWREELQQAVKDTAAGLAKQLGERAGSSLLFEARAALARTGAVEIGDLVFIQSEPRLGHIEGNTHGS